MPSLPDRPILSEAEHALPPFLMNLFELSSLESSGIPVNWPAGLTTSSAHQLIFEFFEPMIEREDSTEHSSTVHTSSSLHAPSPSSGHRHATFSFSHLDPVAPESQVSDVSTSSSLPSPSPSDLHELLDLSDAGESVLWPPGYDARSAAQILKRRRLA